MRCPRRSDSCTGLPAWSTRAKAGNDPSTGGAGGSARRTERTSGSANAAATNKTQNSLLPVTRAATRCGREDKEEEKDFLEGEEGRRAAPPDSVEAAGGAPRTTGASTWFLLP